MTALGYGNVYMTQDDMAKIMEAQERRRLEAIEACPYCEGQILRVESAWGVLTVQVSSVDAPFAYSDQNRWVIDTRFRHWKLQWGGESTISFSELDLASGLLHVEVLQ